MGLGSGQPCYKDIDLRQFRPVFIWSHFFKTP